MFVLLNLLTRHVIIQSVVFQEVKMLDFLVVGIGGFIGCCLRFGITKLMMAFECQLPIATLLSNIIAGFFVGFITGLEANSSLITPKAKLFLTTGMMGGLSTFSTFSMETIRLFSECKYMQAVGNVLLNITLSFAGVVVGIFTAKLLFSKK